MSTNALDHIRVRDAMHAGIVTTDAGTPLRTVARTMAERRVHAVAVVTASDRQRPWAIVSARDVAAAAARGIEITAGEAAATEALTISSGDRLSRAVQLMTDNDVGHLIVVDKASGYPTGVLSLLDVVAAYGR